MGEAGQGSVATIAGWLRGTRRAVAFTGAGISTESGIPDFRSPGGVWSRHQPVMYQDFLNDSGERRRYWEIRKESIPQFLAAEPNAGHRGHLESRPDERAGGEKQSVQTRFGSAHA